MGHPGSSLVLAEATAADQKHPVIDSASGLAPLDRSSDFPELEGAWDCLEQEEDSSPRESIQVQTLILGGLGLQAYTDQVSKPSQVGREEGGTG